MNDVAALQVDFESAGLDVDGLLARRAAIMALRRAAITGVNEALIGEACVSRVLSYRSNSGI